jgi:hypothetical protein
MNKIRHSKFRNTGIIFELLVRQIAAETVSGKDSAAINIVKKYFNKTEMAKEHKLYQVLISSKALTEGKAESLINVTLDVSSRLNKSLLRKEKYNIIKDIREHYNIEDFFKAKISNYTQYAAISNLIEMHNSKEFTDPSQMIDNKISVLEHITRSNIDVEEVKNRLIEEYSEMDSGTRILTYKILLEKFNEKYLDLGPAQKTVLREYINNISNTVKLRTFVNEQYAYIKKQLTVLNKSITDQTTQIKLSEVINLLNPLDKNQNVKDENIVSLLQYYQLISELKTIK